MASSSLLEGLRRVLKSTPTTYGLSYLVPSGSSKSSSKTKTSKTQSKTSLLKSHTSASRGRVGYAQAMEYATDGTIPFNEDYWRQQANTVWGSYAARQLAGIAEEYNFTKKSAKQNLELALERIGQERAFAKEDLDATLQELAAQRRWSQNEFNETLDNINRMRKYLGEDFNNTVQELAYQRGLQREEIAQEIMPLAEKVREEAWERGLGSSGLGGKEASAAEALRARQINIAKKTEEFGKKAAEITKTRGLEEQGAEEHKARRILGQTHEEIGFKESAANRAYRQALARYGLDEKEARIGYQQAVGSAGISAGKSRRDIEDQRQIGIEQFVQARRGEAYNQAAAYPQYGVRSTPTTVKTISPTMSLSNRVSKAKKASSPSLLSRVGSYLRRIF